MNGFWFLLDLLCIFLATSSFPDPVGPEIKTLLSDRAYLLICSLIDNMFWLDPIKSKDWNSFDFRFLFSFFKFIFSDALFTKFTNLSLSKGFCMNSKAPDLSDLIAISILAWPEIIITGISLFLFLMCVSNSIPSFSLLSNFTSIIAISGNFLSISVNAWL